MLKVVLYLAAAASVAGKKDYLALPGTGADPMLDACVDPLPADPSSGQPCPHVCDDKASAQRQFSDRSSCQATFLKNTFEQATAPTSITTCMQAIQEVTPEEMLELSVKPTEGKFLTTPGWHTVQALWTQEDDAATDGTSSDCRDVLYCIKDTDECALENTLKAQQDPKMVKWTHKCGKGNTMCVNTNGGYGCVCQDGFGGDPYSERGCEPIQSCNVEYGAQHVLTNPRVLTNPKTVSLTRYMVNGSLWGAHVNEAHGKIWDVWAACDRKGLGSNPVAWQNSNSVRVKIPAPNSIKAWEAFPESTSTCNLTLECEVDDFLQVRIDTYRTIDREAHTITEVSGRQFKLTECISDSKPSFNFKATDIKFNGVGVGLADATSDIDVLYALNRCFNDNAVNFVLDLHVKDYLTKPVHALVIGLTKVDLAQGMDAFPPIGVPPNQTVSIHAQTKIDTSQLTIRNNNKTEVYCSVSHVMVADTVDCATRTNTNLNPRPLSILLPEGDTLKMTVAFPSERELDRDYIFTYADFERELRDQEAVWVYHVDPLSKKNDAMSINRTISRDNSKPSKPSAHFVFDLARVRYDESLNPKCAVKTQPSYDYASCELKVERAVSEVRPYTGSVGLVPFSNRASKQYVDSTDLTQWPKSTNFHGVGYRGEDGDGMDMRLGQPCCTTKTLLPERLQVIPERGLTEAEVSSTLTALNDYTLALYCSDSKDEWLDDIHEGELAWEETAMFKVDKPLEGKELQCQRGQYLFAEMRLKDHPIAPLSTHGMILTKCIANTHLRFWFETGTGVKTMDHVAWGLTERTTDIDVHETWLPSMDNDGRRCMAPNKTTVMLDVRVKDNTIVRFVDAVKLDIAKIDLRASCTAGQSHSGLPPATDVTVVAKVISKAGASDDDHGRGGEINLFFKAKREPVCQDFPLNHAHEIVCQGASYKSKAPPSGPDKVKLAVELAGLPEPPPQQFGRGGELTNLNPLHLTVSANTELSITISYPQCQQTFTYGYDELASLKAGDTKGPFTFGSVEAFTYSKSNDQECSVADEPYFPYPVCLLNRDGWSTREMVESTIDFLALSRQTGLRSAPLPRSIGM